MIHKLTHSSHLTSITLFTSALTIAGLLYALSPAPRFQLRDEVIPKKYTIDLTIDPNRDSFDGWARIEVEITKAQGGVWLNAKDLTILKATIRAGGRDREVRTQMAGGEFIGLEPSGVIGPGTATLSIRYRGRLNEKPLVGPYRVQFEGNWYVFTTFTPIDARRAFPCFDEPRFKALWDITIHTKREYAAFANAPVISEMEEQFGMKAVKFATTEPLPSEVVAFAVGPLETLDGGRVGLGNVPVRIIAPSGHAAEAANAARANADVLPRLEAYTGIPYPYTKLDHIAIPKLAFGATENPGLITYRLDALLLPEEKVSPQKLNKLRSIEAHELAHQWFGDLVTQATWEEVWLSEGFATWLSQKVVSADEPLERRTLNALVARERIMQADAGPKTHAVRLAMHSRVEMQTVYNPFVYQKGAAVLMMLENWLGEEPFRSGLQAYLKKYRFGHATTADLAACLREASGTDPTRVMRAFLDQPGVPTVTAEVRCDSDKTPQVVFEQTNTSASWAVPVCWRTETKAASCFVLDTPRKQVSLPSGAACPALLVPNAGGTGYYRTGWTHNQLSALVSSDFTALTPAERLVTKYDLTALEKARHLTTAEVELAVKKLEHVTVY